MNFSELVAQKKELERQQLEIDAAIEKARIDGLVEFVSNMKREASELGFSAEEIVAELSRKRARPKRK